jgi:transcription elongation factor Elf1
MLLGLRPIVGKRRKRHRKPKGPRTKLYVKKTCVACDRSYKVFAWQRVEDVINLHICCERCRTALEKGYELGLRASGRYMGRVERDV